MTSYAVAFCEKIAGDDVVHVGSNNVLPHNQENGWNFAQNLSI